MIRASRRRTSSHHPHKRCLHNDLQHHARRHWPAVERLSIGSALAKCKSDRARHARGRHLVSYGMPPRLRGVLAGTLIVAVVGPVPAPAQAPLTAADSAVRSEEHTSELQSPYVIPYAVFFL